jgi:hypothetical protein
MQKIAKMCILEGYKNLENVYFGTFENRENVYREEVSRPRKRVILIAKYMIYSRL